MSEDYAERLEAAYATRRARVAGTRPDVTEVLSADLRAALDDLNRLRADLEAAQIRLNLLALPVSVEGLRALIAVAEHKPPVKVEVGQVWADKNQWHAGRTCRVVELDDRHAILEVVTEATNKRAGLPSTVGRRSPVLYDHRGIRGYRLINPDGGETQ